MSALRSLLILLIHGASLLAAADAMAQASPKKPAAIAEEKPNLGEPEAVAKARARLLFEKGVTAYREARFYDAVDIFLETNRLYPDPKLSYNVGKAFEGLSNQPGALRYYREYLRRLPEAADAREVEHHVHELELSLSAKGLQQLTVLANADSAILKIDGQAVGVTPWTGETFAGKHRIVLEAAGYQPFSAVLEIDPHRARDFSFELSKTVATPNSEVTSKPLPQSAPPKLSVFTLTTLATGVALLGTALIAQVASGGDSAGVSRSAAFFAGGGAGVSVLGGFMLYFDLNPSGARAEGVSWNAGGLEHGMAR